MEDLYYFVEPEPAAPPPAGVTTGWIIIGSTHGGPGVAMKVQALQDGEQRLGTLVPDGDWEPVTIDPDS